MRKKYLSALLFGALLFASAGTFTSCKDYDDDINNLQEQINTIKTDLESLKSTVEGLDGVKTLSFVDGTLVIETGKGTKVEVPVPSVSNVEQTTVELDGQNLVVNGEVIGQVGDKVTVNEDGYLCVNGEATEIKAGKYAILNNESDNTYTITLPDAEGNMQTITLLKSVATNITIKVYHNTGNDGKYSIFSEIEAEEQSTDVDKNFQSNYGIEWGVAEKDIDWKGPKGTVKAGQLLVGQQNWVSVDVYPNNVELDKQVLKLVDINGNEAPVIVTASPSRYGEGHTGSRSVALGGAWVLEVTMNETVSGNNMGTAFAQKYGTENQGNHDTWANKTYALQVNGNILTGYEFVVDTQAAACAMTGTDALWNETTKSDNGTVQLDFKPATNDQFTASLGKGHILSYVQSSVYDYMFEIVDADKNDAEAWGIKLENNVLYAENTTKAAGKKIHLNVILLGVNGEIKDFGYTSATTTPITVEFGNVTSDAITLPVSEYKVTPKQYDWSIPGNNNEFATITLDMGDLFSGMTAEEAIAVAKGGTVLKTTDETFPFLRETIVNKFGKNTENSTIKFYKADAETEVTYDDLQANIRNIKYAKVIYAMPNASDLWNYKATLGQHILTLTLEDATGNQIRKANVPVNVTIPSFFELFTKSAAWGDKTAVAVVDGEGNLDLKQLYNDKTAAEEITYFDSTSSFIANGESAAERTKDNAGKLTNIVKLNDNAADGHSFRDLSSKLNYTIVPECDNFDVTSGNFTIDLITRIDGAKFVYYVDGKETDIVVEPESENVIKAFNKETGDKRQGLSFYKAGKDNVFTTGSVVNGLELDLASGANYIAEFDDNAGDKAKAEFSYGDLKLSGLAEPNTADGYTTVLTITYKKASKAGETDIWETFKINLTVKK